VNKLRALGSWYTKGLDNGSHLRTAVNSAESLAALTDIIVEFFIEAPRNTPPASVSHPSPLVASTHLVMT
jgi:hypothetical protein